MAVRRESVRIDVDSNLAAVATRDAAAVKLLANTIDSLAKHGVQSDRANKRITDSLDKVDSKARKTDASINALTGRLRLAADVAGILGPALVPLGAVSIAGIAAVANTIGFAAAAGGTAILAFQGVGDAVTALNKAALEPTNENLLAAEVELARLSPAASDFARQISSMRDEWLGLRDAAASGLFPELTTALGNADVVFDRAERVLESIGSATGQMLADGIDSLGTDRWAEFTSFLEREAKPVMSDLGAITGSFTHGLAELWMATQPLNRDMSSWLVDSAAGFDDWAQGLDQTEGFANFVDYLQDNGPQVAETAAAIGKALVDIVTAVAPLGGPSLKILEAVADVFSTIADSPIGTPLLTAAAGLAALNRGLAIGGKISAFDAKSTALGKTLTATRAGATGLADDLGAVGITSRQSAADVDKARGRLSGYAGVAGKAGLAAAGLAVATTDLGAGLLGTSTASGAMMGAIGGIRGSIIGAAIGAILDLRSANADLEQSMNDLNAAAGRQDFAGETDAYSRAADMLREQGQLRDDFFGSVGDQTKQLFSGDFLAGAKAGLSDVIGYGVSDARDDLAEYNGQLERLATRKNFANNVLGAPFADASSDINGATSSVLNFIDATTRLEGVLAEEGALVNYEAAMDDLNASLKTNGDNFNVQTEAGRANTQQLLTAGQAAIDYAKNLKGADRTRFLENARKDLRSVAEEFPKAGRLIADINRELRKASAAPMKVRVDASGLKVAEGQARRLRTVYDGLPTELQTRIETTGVPKSRQEVRVLAEAYDLTPKEVRTLMTLQSAAAKTGIFDVQALLRQTGGMRPRPSVSVDDNASGILRSIQSAILGIPLSRTSTITTVQRTILETVRLPPGKTLGASGFAEGGYVRGPGTTTSDSIPTLLSDREFVMKAAAVRKYGLEQMNAMNAMTLPTVDRADAVARALPPMATGNVNAFDQVRTFDARNDTQMRHQAERQGVASAMRSSGGGGTRTIVVQQTGPMRIEGKLKTPFGIADIEGIAEAAADRRIEDYQAANDDYADSMSGRMRDL